MQQSIETCSRPQADTSRRDLRSLDWFQFEKLIGLLFQHEGFSVQRGGGANPDGGIDLVATKNGITFGVQCKHWKAWRINVKEVRSFFGALHDKKIHHGFLITIEGFTKEAAEYARRNNIEIMDETMLTRNLEAVGWRFQTAFKALLNDTRKMCPKCESEMVLRTTRKGTRAGQKFFGCSTYPRCSFTMAAT